MFWSEIFAVALLGLGGSFGHCVGMCGGFALAIGRDSPGGGRLFFRHLAYQSGKALTYVFLSVLLVAGLGLVGRAGGFAAAQTVLSVVAGLVMLVYGLLQVTEWRIGARWSRVLEPFPGCRGLVAVAGRAGMLPAFLTGWLNGFLPCGLVLGALAQLASTGSVTAAALGAAVFGFATFPGLFVLGLAAQAWNPRWRRVLVRVTGVLLVLFGVVTIIRAFPEGRMWLMEHVIPSVSWGRIREWCGF